MMLLVVCTVRQMFSVISRDCTLIERATATSASLNTPKINILGGVLTKARLRDRQCADLCKVPSASRGLRGQKGDFAGKYS
jgi:hypothetical protein